MKNIILIIIVLAAGIALGIYFQMQPKTQKIETKTEMDASHAADDVKTDTQKADSIAASVKTDIKAGVDKTKEIATNVVDKVKAGAQKVGEVTTNVVGDIKDKLP